MRGSDLISDVLLTFQVGCRCASNGQAPEWNRESLTDVDEPTHPGRGKWAGNSSNERHGLTTYLIMTSFNGSRASVANIQRPRVVERPFFSLL